MSIRTCPAPTGSCVVAPATDTDLLGGPLVGASGVLSDGRGNLAQANVDLGRGDALPVVGLASQSASEGRVGATGFGFSAFKYTGSQAIDLGLDLNYHYITSGSVAGDTLIEYPDEGDGNAFLSVNTPVAFAGLSSHSTAEQIFNVYQSLLCGGSGLGGTYLDSGSTVGENTVSGLATGCSGGAITIQPGQTFVVTLFMQAFSDRSGYIDATHTLQAAFDPSHTYIAGTQTLVNPDIFATSFHSVVPEPGTWALMLTGVGGAGVMLRRRSRKLAA